ncbi:MULTISPECIES: MFS transporter [Roseobacteraceae]|uniref:Putative MFS-type transporter EfpA n=1 Tax=Pseudosulfitobacter pseudonitzschiae TaxID=1402135 RepID=A0A221K3D3_9RHOB|nr:MULTISPECIES: MFS transporter [Roseobacteraceae]ASM73347.1 putative MFS-type transporter EfpA [Pseudosulfitobacter pseudonitzschiae]
MTISNTTNLPFASPRLAFPLLALVQAILIFTITLISVPLPLIGREFGLDTAELVLLQVSYGLPYSGLLLLGGGLSDRFGGTPVLHIGLWIFGLSSLGAALSTSFEQLVAMRAVQGMAAAMIAPAAVAHVAVLYPDAQDFDRAMARWGGVSVLGAAAGTVLSGVLTTWVSWRWMFAVPCVTVFVALVLRGRVFPVVQAHALQGRLDVLGAVLALLAFVSGGYALSMGSEHSWLSASVAGAGILAVLAMAGFVWWERRAALPLLPPDFFDDRRRVIGSLGILLAAASMGLVTFILALYLQDGPGWSPLATAMAMVPYLAVLVLGGVPATGAVLRLGAARAMVLGLCLAVVGLGLLSGFGPDYLAQILPGLVILPAGTSLMFASSAVLLTQGMAPERMGLAAGVMNTAMELGPTAGMAGFLAFTALRHELKDGWSLALMAAAGVALMIALYAALGQKERGNG